MNLIGGSSVKLKSTVLALDEATALVSLVDVAQTASASFVTLRSITIPAGYDGRISFYLIFEAKCQSVGHIHHIHIKKGTTSWSPAVGNTAQAYIQCSISGTTYRQFRFVLAGSSGDVFNIVGKSDDGVDKVIIYNVYLEGNQRSYTDASPPTVSWDGAIV